MTSDGGEEMAAWSWPPSKEVLDLFDLIKPVTNLVTCFDSNDLPEVVHPPELDFVSAVHGCIFARTCDHLKGLIMMHLRFDGKIGFPGGIIEKGEKVIDALNREMEEEIGLDLSKYAVNESDFLCCDYLPLPGKPKATSSCRFFYAKEVPVQDFADIERNAMTADHFGTENMGQIRAPLHTYRGNTGLPIFVDQRFAGTALRQMLLTTYAKKLLTFEELKRAWELRSHPMTDASASSIMVHHSDEKCG